MIIGKPVVAHTPEYYRRYINLVPEEDLITALAEGMKATITLVRSLPGEKADFRYAAGKWSAKEVLGHINDTERIFAYRALRFSRKDATALPPFDENLYAPNANTDHCSLHELSDEYRAIRNASIALFAHMNDEMLDLPGKASGYDLTPRSIGWMIAGHNIHHCNILREHYL
jgi:hypothetical protein